MDKYKDYLLENIDKLKGKTIVNKVRKRLSNIRTKRMIIERSRTMSSAEEDAHLRHLTRKETA